mgnify:CR=1 FL=1
MTLRPDRGPARRSGGRVLVTLLLVVMVGTLMLALLGMGLWYALAAASDPGLTVTINGEDVSRIFDLGQWSTDRKVVLVLAGAVALVLAMVVLPMALAAGAVVLTLTILATMSVPLLVALVMATVVGAPLILLAWWLRTRQRRQIRDARSIDA